MTAPKYSLEAPEAKIGKDGFATTAGWLTTYNSDTRSREYTGARQDYIQVGIGLAAGAYIDAPTLPTEQNKAVRRKQDGSAWEIVDDYRGQLSYNTETRQAATVDYISAVLDGWTLLEPSGPFDKWNGKKWVTDAAAQKAAAQAAAQSELEAKLQKADAVIQRLTMAVKHGMATDEDKASLEEWEKYSVLLGRVDTSKPEWPTEPEHVA